MILSRPIFSKLLFRPIDELWYHKYLANLKCDRHAMLYFWKNLGQRQRQVEGLECKIEITLSRFSTK